MNVAILERARSDSLGVANQIDSRFSSGFDKAPFQTAGKPAPPRRATGVLILFDNAARDRFSLPSTVHIAISAGTVEYSVVQSSVRCFENQAVFERVRDV